MSTTSQQATSASTASFVTAIVLNAAVFAVEIAAFTLLRPRFKSIYEPRTYLTPEDKRSPPLAQKFWAWPVALYKADYRQILPQNGIDAYMFVRFLRMMVKILLPIWVISWAVLLPVTSVGTSVPGRSGLDRFTYGNVAPNESSRYAAHIILAWLFTGYIFYVLRGELQHFISTRQHHLVDPAHSATAQANTILVTGVPAKYLTEDALTHLFGHLPGGVRRVWVNRDLKELPAVHSRRLAACGKLESAENALLKTAAKLTAKGKAAPPDPESAAEVVPREKRPSHRLPPGPLPFSLPLLGKKVDSIDWAREEIVATNAILQEQRRIYAQDSAAYPPLNSAFVLFNQQIAAHLAANSLVHHEPYRMARKYTDVAPADVVWGNLGLNPYEATIRTAISYAITAGLIILWAFPVAFIGLISNVHGLCTTEPWLAWLCDIPDVVIGIIQGILPAVLLAVLMMLLPIILRLLARFEGIPTYSGIELSLMTRYFIFQVIHGFLIVTLSSGIIAALPQLTEDPTSIPSILAEKLPNASTFFLTYIVLQGLTVTAGGFLTIVPLAIYYVKLVLLGSTPRSIYNIRYTLRSVAWGTLFPTTTLLVVISMGYSIISPIVNGFACAAFVLFFLLWKYLFLWQLDIPRAGETGGLFFPKAIQHVFVGLYIQQLCLCALFFLAQDENGKQSAIPEGALMVVLIVCTAFYNHLLNSSYAPLLHALPLTLADKTFSMPPHDGTPGSEEPKDATRPRGEFRSSDEMPLADGKEKPLNEKSEERDADGSVPDSQRERHGGDGDFVHPAAAEPQRPIWLAADTLGLGQAEARALNAEGVDASTAHATMDAKGSVEIDGHPPGEESLIR